MNCAIDGLFNSKDSFVKDVSSYHAWLIEIALLITAFAFGIFGLDRSPTVWYDETFTNDVAYQLAYHGKIVLNLEPDVASLDKAYLGPPLYAVFHAAIFRIFGFGIWQVRLSALFFHLLSGLLLFLAARTYFHHRGAGLLSSGLFLLDPAIVKSWRSGRRDAMAIFLGILAVYILISILRSSPMHTRKRFALYALAGAIAGLACITHATCISFAIAGVILLLFGLNIWKERFAALILYSIGAILGAALWLGRILIYPDIFAQQFLSLSARYTGITGLLPGLMSQVKHLAFRYRIAPFLLCTYIGGVIWGLKSARFRMLSLASCWMLFFYFTVLRTSHPLPYIVPIVILGAGGLAIFYISRLSVVQTKFRVLLVLLALAVFANGLSVLALRAFATIWQWEGRSHSAFVDEWQEKIRSGASVAAPPQCWYAALGNGNTYRYHKIIGLGAEEYRSYRIRLVEDNVEYLVLPAGADLHKFLLDEHIHLFQHADSIRRPMRYLPGIDVVIYDFDIYQRKSGQHSAISYRF